MAQIYIVEDDVNIREIECIALKNSGHEVMDFECAADFYKGLQRKMPDLIVLDIMLPDEDGNEIVRKLRAQSATKKVPIIMVTAKTTEIDMVKGLDIGADDYIKKPFSVIELITRVKALLRRSMEEKKENYLSVDNIVLDEQRHSVFVDETICELTFKEYELLKLLMKNVGIVMTRELIMQNVWGTNFEGESRTVDMHIKTLRHKLGDAGKKIKTIRNVGYVMK